MTPQLIQTLAIDAGLTAITAGIMTARSLRAARAWAIVVAVLFVGGFWYLRGQQTALFSDAPFHLALIQATAERGMFPGDPFFSGMPTSLHYSIWHVAGAGLMRLAGSAEAAWGILGCVYLALLFVVTVWLGRFILREEQAAWGLGLCGLFCYGAVAMVPRLNILACILVWMALLILAGGMARWSMKARCTAAGCLCGLAIMTRMCTGVIGWLILVPALPMLAHITRLRKKRETGTEPNGAKIRERLGETPRPTLLRKSLMGRANRHGEPSAGSVTFRPVIAPSGTEPAIHMAGAFLLVTLLPIVVALPWCLQFTGPTGLQPGMVQVPPELSPLSWSAARGHDLWEWTFGRAAINPAHAVLLLGLWLVGFILLWIKKSEHKPLQVILIGALFPLLLFALPWEFLLGHVMNAYTLHRFQPIIGRALELSMPLVFLVAPIVVGMGMQRESGGEIRKRLVGGGLAVLGLLILLLGPAARIRMACEYGPDVRPRFDFLTDGLALKPDVFSGKVVLSDAWTSYTLAPRFRWKVVTLPTGHSSSSVPVWERSSEVQRLFSGGVKDEEMASLIHEYGVDFVVVNKQLASGLPIPEFGAPMPEYVGYDAGFAERLPVLNLVAENKYLAVWQANRSR